MSPQKNIHYQPTTLLLPISNNITKIVNIGIIDGGYLPHTLESSHVSEYRDFTGDNNITTLNNIHASVIANILEDINPGSRLFLAKAFSDNTKSATSKAIIQSIFWLIDNGVSIINISLGQYRDCDGSCALCQEIDAIIYENDVQIFVSAGNRSTKNTSKCITCPGSASNVITVGAYSKNLPLTPDADINLSNAKTPKKPDIYAQGHLEWKPPHYYEYTPLSGTSFATPIVCGNYSRFV